METKKKILIIEDNQDVRENIKELLELSNYEVEVAQDGKEGVIKSISFRPNLIVCDIMMPELDGYGVLRILANKPETQRIPFIFLTAKTDRSDLRKGMNLGADDYIMKPFEDLELLDAIQVRLEKVEMLTNEYDQDISGQLSTNIEANKEFFLEQFDSRPLKTYRKKEIIYEQEEMLDFLFYLKTGKVKLVKTNEDGKDFVLDILLPGEFFGYFDLVQESYSSETVIAMEKSEVLQIPKADFQKMLHQNRGIAASFIQFLANNIHEREEKLLHLAYDSVRRRVATALIVLHQKAKQEGKNDILIYREDLAAYVGTAKETVIRTLSDFKEEALIQIRDRGVITIIDTKGLENMPN